MGKKVILKDVATLLNGRAYKQDQLLDSGKYPVLRVGNFFSNRGWFYSDLELEDEKYCDNGDLLFAWSASFGPKIWDGGKVIFHYHIWKILTTPQIDKKYFYYFLENAADRIKESGHGIAMIHTTKSEMEQMELLLPEMEQQLQIATVLDKVSELIELRKEQLAKLDELVKAQFVEMFGDPISNPMDWNIDCAENHIDLLSGFPFDSSEYTEYGVNICGGLIILPQRIVWDECKHWKSTEGYEQYTLCKNDIVMALDRPWISEGFKIAMVDEEHLPALLIQRTARIRAIDMNQLYLMHCFLLGGFEQHCNVTGSLVPHISAKDIRSFKLMLPPLELQTQFATFVEQTNKTKLTIQSSLDKLEVMKKALMQEYFG